MNFPSKENAPFEFVLRLFLGTVIAYALAKGVSVIWPLLWPSIDPVTRLILAFIALFVIVIGALIGVGRKYKTGDGSEERL